MLHVRAQSSVDAERAHTVVYTLQRVATMDVTSTHRRVCHPRRVRTHMHKDMPCSRAALSTCGAAAIEPSHDNVTHVFCSSSIVHIHTISRLHAYRASGWLSPRRCVHATPVATIEASVQCAIYTPPHPHRCAISSYSVTSQVHRDPYASHRRCPRTSSSHPHACRTPSAPARGIQETIPHATAHSGHTEPSV